MGPHRCQGEARAEQDSQYCGLKRAHATGLVALAWDPTTGEAKAQLEKARTTDLGPSLRPHQYKAAISP